MATGNCPCLGENMDKKIRVLIVDDDEKIGKAFSRILSEEGVDAQYVCDGRSAVEKIKKEQFDLVFMDVIMPEFNGIQTLEEIRKFNTEIKAAMITGYSVEEMMRKAEQYNICATLHKPVSIVRLLEVIRDNCK